MKDKFPVGNCGSGLAMNLRHNSGIRTTIIVALMVYVIMPRYTKLVRNWLFN